MDFGTFVRTKRLQLNLSLRKFAELLGMDPSRWSKIERGSFPFPSDEERFEKLAMVLQIEPKSGDWYDLRDYVSISRRQIPVEVYNDEELLKVLPVFFRATNGRRPSTEDLDKLINILRIRHAG